MDFDSLYQQHAGRLEDFWSRRNSTLRFVEQLAPCGRPVQLASNDPLAAGAASQIAAGFTLAPLREGPSHAINVIVAGQETAEPPADLFDHIQYTGYGRWLGIRLGGFGFATADLERKEAWAVVDPGLGRRPELLTRYVLNTLVLNFLIASELGFLHATGLTRAGRALLILGGHNQGKSTTALRLLEAGWSLIADSHVFVEAEGEELLLYGFPVGRLRLRPDVLPARARHLMPEPVRGELKYRLDLRAFAPERVQESVVRVLDVELYLLGLHDGEGSYLEPAGAAEVWQALMANSLYYDTPASWGSNLAQLERLVARAQCRRLWAGRDPEILAAVLE